MKKKKVAVLQPFSFLIIYYSGKYTYIAYATKNPSYEYKF